jgi:hypothetical protein
MAVVNIQGVQGAVVEVEVDNVEGLPCCNDMGNDWLCSRWPAVK